MSTPYTEAEIWTKIRTIVTELESVRTKAPKYRIGEKEFDRGEQLKSLERQLAMFEKMADKYGTSSGATQIATVPDYDMDRFGIQNGTALDGED